MRLTHLADYAVVIMTAAARAPAGVRLSAAALADKTGVPLPTAQKLMGKLGMAGLLASVRGAGGGFTLARTAEAISLADIIEAVEGPIAMTQCSGSEEASECALDAHCRVKPHMSVVSRAVRGALAGVTLESLAASRSAHPEEGLSSLQGVAKARLEGVGDVLRDDDRVNHAPHGSGSSGGRSDPTISTSSAAPQHERFISAPSLSE